MTTTPTTPTPTEVTIDDQFDRPTTIRVHVHYQTPNPDNTYPIIESTHPIPTMSELYPHLPETIQRLIDRHGYQNYRPDQCCTRAVLFGITAPMLQDAIVSSLLTRYSEKHPEATVATFPDVPCYLAANNMLYKLQPIAIVKANGALRAMRRHTLARANDDAKAIVQRANVTAHSIVKNADNQLAEANRIVTNARRSNLYALPAFLIGRTIIPSPTTPGLWSVLISLSITFSHLEYHWESIEPVTKTVSTTINHTKRWNAVSHDPIPVKMWLKINSDGTYNPTAIYLDSTSPVLPHMSHEHACMGIADAPATITTADDLNRLCTSLVRTMSVVDYTSPLVIASEWPAVVRRCWPTALLDHLRGTKYEAWDRLRKATDHTTYDKQTPQQENAEVWRA